MFYSVLALLIYEPYSSSKHSGIRSLFHQNFVKTGVVDTEFGNFMTGYLITGKREIMQI